MTIDMQQFHSVFFEESKEHLEEMEQTFLEMDVNAPTDEQLNSIFRAAHSIKGGSGVFGFDALIGLTHVMESVLDKARKHALTLSEFHIETLVKATDELSRTLDAYIANEEPNWSALENQIHLVEAILTGKEVEKASDDKAKQSKAEYEIFDVPVEPDDDAFGFFEPLEDASDIDSAVEQEQPIPEPAPKASKVAKPNQDDTDQSQTTTASSTSSSGTGLTTIRVDTTKIDELMNLVGEMVITQSMLFDISKGNEQQAGDDRLQSAVLELERNTRLIQEAVMSMRMLPMSFVFNRFPRVVRDIATKLDKNVELKIIGAETEIDKGLTEKLVDPLTHLIRNSIDHGIETPAERLACGKPETGKITLAAAHQGGSILVKVTDDGAGLNREKIIKKAKENGRVIEENASDNQIWPLIFEPGFSTAHSVSDLSGRGVGMDVVKRNIESIGGVVEIHSTPKVGTSFHIRLPLTLAIVDGMTVGVESETYIIPLVSVIESVCPTKEQVKCLGGQQLIWLRDQYWPVLFMHQIMGLSDSAVNITEAVAVLIESNNKRYCLVVDALLNQQQVVVKSLEQNYKKVDGIAGATILGDGRVALILDVDSLGKYVNLPAELKELSHAE